MWIAVMAYGLEFWGMRDAFRNWSLVLFAGKTMEKRIATMQAGNDYPRSRAERGCDKMIGKETANETHPLSQSHTCKPFWGADDLLFVCF